jgi:hypothetical protein
MNKLKPIVLNALIEGRIIKDTMFEEDKQILDLKWDN